MNKSGLGRRDLSLIASCVVPGGPKAAHGSTAYEYWSQVANVKKLSVVFTIEAAELASA